MEPYARTYISVLGTIRVDRIRYKHKKLYQHRGRLVEIRGRKPVEVYLAGSKNDGPLVVLYSSDRIA